MKAKIAKWGNSLALRLPKQVTDQAGMAEGQMVELTVRDGQLVVDSTPSDFVYRLDDLVAQMKPENAPPFEDWNPVGEEWPDEDWSDLAPRDDEKANVTHAGRRRTSSGRR